MIAIVPYDLTWPALFDAEATLIRAHLSDLALRVEHVGSTAVPGLPAKAVVDIQVSVASLEPMSSFHERLAQIGYRHIPLGAFDLVYPFFRKPAEEPTSHHVHFCIAGSEQERNHLAFRDYLRSHPLVAAEYVVLKRQLASLHHGTTLESQERYSLSKSDFVASVLARAFADGYSSIQHAA